MHILVINPKNEANLPILQLGQLASNGHEITLVGNGKEGRAYFHDNHDKLDAVVFTPVGKNNPTCTINDTVSAYADLKADVNRQHPIPVIVLYNKGMKKKTVAAFQAYREELKNRRLILAERPVRTTEYKNLLENNVLS